MDDGGDGAADQAIEVVAQSPAAGASGDMVYEIPLESENVRVVIPTDGAIVDGPLPTRREVPKPPQVIDPGAAAAPPKT